MTTGLILGKFLPPHRGHEYLVNFADGFADLVTVHVCPTDADPIPGELRYQWMRETFAGRENIRVVYNPDPLPQTPEDDPENFWRLWRESLLKRQPGGKEPTYIFASEEYGFRLAETLNAVYIPVDHLRGRFPVSGTAIRQDAFSQWEYLLPATRPYFAKRVAIVGPESSGKSTLTERLAQQFGTTFAPEYARTYLETIPAPALERLYAPGGFDIETMHHFIRGQAASVEAMARQCNRVVFSDTEAIVTALYCRLFLGHVPPFVWEQVERQRYDLYLLMSASDDWTHEEQRIQPVYADRVRFEEECRAMLDERAYPYVRLHGSWQEREAQAIETIETKVYKGKRAPQVNRSNKGRRKRVSAELVPSA
ncbi:MAG: AAA family ATPase [Fibrella sp.]|nr:AAA family ATPase [Armatimonadota bacterium]